MSICTKLNSLRNFREKSSDSLSQLYRDKLQSTMMQVQDMIRRIA